jgi:hypothetical protein
VSEASTSAGAVQASQPIAFRQDDADLATSATHVLLVTVLLLGAVLGALVIAKRRGWLQRWTGGAAPATPSAGTAGLRVEQRLRLSARTTLFRVADGDRRYIVVESTGGVQLAVDPHAEHTGHD